LIISLYHVIARNEAISMLYSSNRQMLERRKGHSFIFET
jgi:hypothetical protein